MENSINKYMDFNINLATCFKDNIDIGLEFIDYASSVNIACSAVNGLYLSIKDAVEHCKFKSKEIGALISLPDSVSEPLSLSADEVEAIVLYQLGAISSFTKAASLNIEHVRPYGLMYKTASENLEFSLAIAKAVKKYSEWLILYGASGNIIKETGAEANIVIAQEIQINKKYNQNGSIDYSSENITDSDVLLGRLKHLFSFNEIDYSQNNYIKTECDSIYFDVENAAALEVIKQANNFIEPRPANYNKVVSSGWVE